MTSGRTEKRIQQSSSAVALVDCSVRVSPALARLIRKSAEQEAKGASALDALSIAAGMRPSDLAAANSQIQLASKEAMEWREKLTAEHKRHEQLKTAMAATENEKASLRRELGKATDLVKAQLQQISIFEAKVAALEKRIAELATTLEDRDRQLAHSFLLAGLDNVAIASIKALRDRLARGEIQFTSHSEAEAMIANFGRPEMRSLNKMLTRHARGVSVIRWLLRIHSPD